MIGIERGLALYAAVVYSPRKRRSPLG